MSWWDDFYYVDADYFKKWKDDIKNYIKKYDYPEFTLDEILTHVKNNVMQCWIYYPGKIEAVLFTQIMDFEKWRNCIVFYVEGENHEKWLEFISYIENWARNNGCKKIQLWGRKGWIKLLRTYNYQESSILLEKLL